MAPDCAVLTMTLYCETDDRDSNKFSVCRQLPKLFTSWDDAVTADKKKLNWYWLLDKLWHFLRYEWFCHSSGLGVIQNHGERGVKIVQKK